MTGRLIWWAALALLAAVAVVAQVDRQARYDGGMVHLVPTAYGGFAAEQRVRTALAQDNSDAALTDARRLIRSRPLPADHLTLLALAHGAAGEREAALAALEAAAARGWRDPLPQLAAAQAALDTGAHAVAAQRISALLATGALPEETTALFNRLIATQDGRTAMAERYAARGHWQASTLGRLAANADPADLAATLRLALANGANLPCPLLRQTEATLARRGAPAGLVDASQASCQP